MSLILCPECGTKISDRATKCPHCGFQSAVDDHDPSVVDVGKLCKICVDNFR